MGVKAQDILNTAISCLGMKESDGSFKKIIDGYNAQKNLPLGYEVKYTDEWCDTFLSYLFIVNDAVDLIGGAECGVERHIQLFKKAGIWDEDGSITPTPGSVICYNWDDSTQPNDGFADHIGIVKEVFGTDITIIEGNYNEQVAERIIPVGWGYIRGYAFPHYDTSDEKPAPVSKPTAVDISKPIIDVSEWQGIIDWEAVKPQIGGAIIRVAYGTKKVDNYVTRNLSECDRLGIPYGVYIYSLAGTDVTARAEAEKALQLIKGHKLTMPVYIDIEEGQYRGVARVVAKAFCDVIRVSGYKYGIYASESYFNSYIYGVDIPGCSYWIARYGTNDGRKQTKPNVKVDIDGWQYTSVGRFLGISGNVDTNEFYNDFGSKNEVDKTVHYRAHVQKKGWMSPVTDGEWAGTRGEGLRLEAFKVTPPEGVELEVTVHLQGIGDKVYKGIKKGKSSGTGSSDNDPIIGTIGEARRLEGFSIRMTKNPNKLKLYYQGHCQTYGDTKVCTEGEYCGTRGQSKRLEALRMEFVS